MGAKRKLSHVGKRLEKSRWWVQKEVENKRVSKRVCQTDLLSNQLLDWSTKSEMEKFFEKTRYLE